MRQSISLHPADARRIDERRWGDHHQKKMLSREKNGWKRRSGTGQAQQKRWCISYHWTVKERLAKIAAATGFATDVRETDSCRARENAAEEWGPEDSAESAREGAVGRRSDPMTSDHRSVSREDAGNRPFQQIRETVGKVEKEFSTEKIGEDTRMQQLYSAAQWRPAHCG
ncbi:hypothetical protein BHE74_00051041 [Ensete ventricosum]|nr:hypothetical protein BHE74_00051041 [Ensete ventricosum]